MKEYLEKTLCQNVVINETEYLNDKLPLKRYQIRSFKNIILHLPKYEIEK